MELFDVINQRRSIRKYKNIPIPDEILHEMLEAARLAPSPGNSQGHFFGVIKDSKVKENLAKAAGNQLWIATAPIVFACCADISWDIANQPKDDFGLIINKQRFNDDFIDYLCKYPDRKACMTLFENAIPLIPTEHIFLTAISHGLNACFIGYLNVEEANMILKLPPNITCLFLLPVGYADETPGDKYLKDLKDIVFYDQWEKKNSNC